MKKEIVTAKTADAIAAIYAADEYQEKLAKSLNSNFDREGHKPSQPLYVLQVFADQDAISHKLPAVKDLAIKTLGMENRWTDENAITLEVTDAHRDLAAKAIDAIRNATMMSVLKGEKINGFIGNMTQKLELEEITSRDIGLLTFVPKTAKQYIDNAATDDVKSQFVSTSKALGTQGTKIWATVTVFNIREMKQYDSILYDTHDDQGNLISFFKNEASKEQFEVGQTYKINAKIKVAAENPYSMGAIVNTVNYVRKEK